MYVGIRAYDTEYQVVNDLRCHFTTIELLYSSVSDILAFVSVCSHQITLSF